MKRNFVKEHSLTPMFAIVILASVVGCGGSSEPTLSSTKDELAQFMEEHPELQLDEEDYAQMGTGAVKGEEKGL